MIHILLKGLLIGFAIAAPVGPIGVLCIQRALHNGFKIGLATGLGAAFADGVYGIIAGFGLTVVSSFLINHKYAIQLVGGLFLLYLGVKMIVSPASKNKPGRVANENSPFHAIFTTFLLTLSNPATILSFVAIFAGLGVESVHSSYLSSTLLVLGVIIGSTLWWIFLISLVAIILRHRLSDKVTKGIKITSGLIILLFGIVAIASNFI